MNASPTQTAAPTGIQQASRDYRLGIICADFAAQGPQGKYMVTAGFGRLVEAICQRIPQTRLCVPVLSQVPDGIDHELRIEKERIIPLPPMNSTIAAQKHFFAARRIIRQFAGANDVLHVRLPFVLPRALLRLNRPKIVHVVGDVRAVIQASADYKGLVRMAALAFARDAERVSRRLVAEPMTRVVTHGQQLWDLLHCRNGRVVVSSCVLRAEMQPRTDLSLNTPPKILFVGYLRPEKGAMTLLRAFEMISAKRDICWTIVGGTDRAQSAAEQEIRTALLASKYRDRIRFVGTVPFGEALFDIYRQHDVYVLASLSEGTPRTLIEARAFGCPVVATAVGGVPASVSDGVDGILIPPEDPAAMAAAIERLLDDDDLRRKLIANGLQRTGGISVEDFAQNIVEEIDAAVGLGAR